MKSNIRSPRLRDKIWMLYLTDLDSTPQMYRFTLLYPQRYISSHPKRIDLRDGDQVFLQSPLSFRRGRDISQAFKSVTTTRRIASATCVESRQAVLETYPDTLKFHNYFPSHWMFDESQKGVKVGTVYGAGYPEYTLRYNGSKDIIILHASWEEQQAAVEIAKLNGSPPEDFLKIRHLGIGVEDFQIRYKWVLRYWRTPREECRCLTEECDDCCKIEPLLGFLSLFPLLKTFYIAGGLGTSRSSGHSSSDEIRAGPLPSGTLNCPCPDDRLKHSWPMTKGCDICGWFAIYDERSTCSFPKFDRIERIRQRWRPHFPYYRALDYLDIKFMQLYNPNSTPCSHCVYVN